MIGTAIQNLLGIDMVSQLEEDLQVYERRKRVEDKNDSLNSKIVSSQDIVRALQKKIDNLKQEHAALRTHRIDRQRRVLHEVENEYRKLGGKLYDQRNKIEQKWVEARNAVKNSENDLHEIASGAAPLLLVRTLLEATESRDRHEEESRLARNIFKELTSRDQATLKRLRAQKVSQNAMDSLQKFFKEDRKVRRAASKKKTILDLSPETRRDLHVLLMDDLNTVSEKMTRVLGEKRKFEATEKRAQVKYKNIPDTDIIAKLESEREALKQEIASLESLYSEMGEEIEKQERELKRNEQALERLIEAVVTEQNVRDDRSRILRHATRVRTTLNAFRCAVIKRHIHRIEQLVLESYKQLLRKSCTCDSLVHRP